MSAMIDIYQEEHSWGRDEWWEMRLHFIDVKTKAQEDQVFCPSPHSYLAWFSGFGPHSLQTDPLWSPPVSEFGLQPSTSLFVLWAWMSTN